MRLRRCESAIVLSLLAAAASAQFNVVAATPANCARGVPPAAVVRVTFSAAVDPLTVTAPNFRVAGRWSGPVPGSLTIDAAGTAVTFRPSRPMFATEIGTLMVSHFVRSLGGTPLAGGFATTWWVDAAASSGSFVLDHTVNYRRPGEGAIRTYGFFAGDVDRDGSPDMSATNEVSWDIRLLKNDGCGSFGAPTVTAMPNGEEPSPNEGADFDGDGWIDLATGNQNGNSVAVLLNNGAGGYLAPVVYAVGGSVHGLALLDADSDGDVDIVATNQADLVLLRNNGNGTFQPAVAFDGGGNGEWSVAAIDANNDGRTDLFCGHANSQTVALLLGDGAGTFTVSATRALGGFPWQMAAGDVDGDGKADCALALNSSNGRAAVVTGTGLGGLNAALSYAVGAQPVSMDLGDLEGDDDLDILVANFGSANAAILRNNGAGVFAGLTSLAATAAGSCGVIVDYDRDGDTDMIVVDELDDRAFVWRQVGPAPAGVQPPACGAALRVNSMAVRAGYGGRPPQLLPGGSVAFVNTSGVPGRLFALLAGTPMQPGQASPYGLVNLDFGLPVLTVLFGVLDAAGESLLGLQVPVGLPPGSTITFQGAVDLGGGLLATNPEQVVF